MKILIIITPSTHDSDDVRWLDDNNKFIGYGYRGKVDGVTHVVRCPFCDTENYAIQQAIGPCYKCNFDPNKEGGEDNGSTSTK